MTDDQMGGTVNVEATEYLTWDKYKKVIESQNEAAAQRKKEIRRRSPSFKRTLAKREKTVKRNKAMKNAKRCGREKATGRDYRTLPLDPYHDGRYIIWIRKAHNSQWHTVEIVRELRDKYGITVSKHYLPRIWKQTGKGTWKDYPYPTEGLREGEEAKDCAIR